MPQMAPISWLILFIVFLICLLLFSILNYFAYFIQPSTSSFGKSNSMSSYNWKW